MHIDPLIIVFGLGVGMLIGMTGVGAGSLMTPLLVLVLGIKPLTAVGSDLAYAAVTNSVGGWRHWRKGTVQVALSTWLAVGAVPAAVLGVLVLKALENGDHKSFDDTLLIALGAAILLCAVTMLARLVLPDSAARERERVSMAPRARITALVLGAMIGFIVGVSSAGSGTLITMAMIMVFRLAPRQVVATSVFNSAILLWAAALAHVVAGDVDYGLAGTIMIGSVPGVWVGSALSYRMPVGTLRIVLALLLMGAGLALGKKAGIDIPTAVIAAFPVLVGAAFALAHVRWRPSARALARPARE
jgi:uncharacterized membrane protein YfcA